MRSSLRAKLATVFRHFIGLAQAQPLWIHARFEVMIEIRSPGNVIVWSWFIFCLSILRSKTCADIVSNKIIYKCYSWNLWNRLTACLFFPIKSLSPESKVSSPSWDRFDVHGHWARNENKKNFIDWNSMYFEAEFNDPYRAKLKFNTRQLGSASLRLREEHSQFFVCCFLTKLFSNRFLLFASISNFA